MDLTQEVLGLVHGYIIIFLKLKRMTNMSALFTFAMHWIVLHLHFFVCVGGFLGELFALHYNSTVLA